jgi:hypothetical protein
MKKKRNENNSMDLIICEFQSNSLTYYNSELIFCDFREVQEKNNKKILITNMIFDF